MLGIAATSNPMAHEQPMWISPRFTAQHWLLLDKANDADWSRALEIFRDRIEGRFFRPIRCLLRDKWSGFAILALDSLLIETLQQFWEGEKRTPSKLSPQGCRQLRSEEYFRAFLRGPLFKAGFSKQTSRLFYKTVRCGILHQAETEGSSRVRRSGGIVKLRPDHHGINIDPVKFHDELERAFGRYLDILADKTQTTRRRNFWTKMDYIARKPSSAVDAT
jgi:hypothetical protein